MPRQAPSTGIPRSSARARQGDLEAVALGPGEPGLGVRRGAVAGGVDVRAAREQQAVDPVEQGSGASATASSGGRTSASAPARCTAAG